MDYFRSSLKSCVETSNSSIKVNAGLLTSHQLDVIAVVNDFTNIVKLMVLFVSSESEIKQDFFLHHQSLPVVSESSHDWWEDLNRATFYTAITVRLTFGTRRVKIKDKPEQPSRFFLWNLTLLFDLL